MKPIVLTAIAASTLLAIPAISQQGNAPVSPGANFLANWDLNEDGRVTADELRQRRGDLFASFDENEDGTLNAEEFQALEAARVATMQRPGGQGNGGGRAAQALTFTAIDTNGDNTVSLDEYLAAADGWMTALDSNGDTVLTVDDFGPGARMAQSMQPMQPGQGMAQPNGMRPGRDRGTMQAFNNGSGWPQQAMMPGQRPGSRMAGGHGGAMQGGHGGQGMGRGQQQAAFEAFPSSDGALWIVDSRTGDILLCKAVDDSDAAAGFAPVCVEAGL